MEPSIERSIAERTAMQLSHITRAQLLELGVDRRAVRRMVDRGRLVPVGGSTFRLGGVPPSFRGTLLAACLETGGVASHRAAARLHGAPRFSSWSRPEVMLRHGTRNPRSGSIIVHRTTNLPDDDIVVIDSIPATSLVRTVLGLAALPGPVSDECLRDTIDIAARDGVLTDRWLWWHLEQRRCKGRNGVRRLEGALEARAGTGRTESWLEREFLRLIDAAGLPRPTVQHRVAVDGAFVARVDCCYERERVVIEVKGHAAHSTQRQREADAARENRLVLLGYRVLQFTYDMIVRDPERVVATIVEALAIARAS